MLINYSLPKSYLMLDYQIVSCFELVKNLPVNAGDAGDTDLISGFKRSPEKEMATPSSILAWKIPQAEEPGGLQSMEWQSQTRLGDQRMHTHTHAHTHTYTHCVVCLLYMCLFALIQLYLQNTVVRVDLFTQRV